MRNNRGTVLIFAYECYPYNRTGSAIGAQRPFQFAKNLAELGWKVIVLCADYKQRRTLAPGRLQVEVERIYSEVSSSLTSEPYTIVPLPSLTHYGWADQLWYRSVKEKEGGMYESRSFSLLRKAATFYNQLFHGDYSWSWTAVAKAFTDHLLHEHPVHLMIGEHSPDAGMLLAHACNKQYHIPWIADFRDPALVNFQGIFRWLYRMKLKSVVSTASAVVNVNPYWTSLDRSLHGKPSLTIVNGYDQELFDQVAPYRFDRFTVSYFGSFSEDRQDIRPSLEALRRFMEMPQHQGNACVFYRGLLHVRFRELSLEAGLSPEDLDTGGFVSREEGVSYMKGSAALLIYTFPPYLAHTIYQKRGVYPGKVFEYMGAGVPALLIPTDGGMLEELLEECHAGIATDDVEEAVAFLCLRYAEWEKNGRVPVGQRTAAAENYSRFEQAKRLDKLLKQIWKG